MPNYTTSRDAIETRAVELGIEDVHYMGTASPDQALLLLPFPVGTMTTDPNAIVDWVEQRLGEFAGQGWMNKFLDLKADERHLFLFAGSKTPMDSLRLMLQCPMPLPSRPPDVTEAITHVWALAPFGEGDLLMWNAELGWSGIEVTLVEAPVRWTVSMTITPRPRGSQPRMPLVASDVPTVR